MDKDIKIPVTNPTHVITSDGTLLASNVGYTTLAELAAVMPGGGGATNLSFTASPTGVTVNSDTGTDAALPLATAVNAGLQSPAQFSKLAFVTVTQAVDLDAIETAATAGAAAKVKTDFITVTQAVDLDALETDVADLTTLTGVASNAADLGTFTGSTIADASTIKSALQALETFAESIVSGMKFAGTWDATTADPSASLANGEFYRVSLAGTTAVITVNVGLANDWQLGDYLMKDNLGNIHKMDNTDPVFQGLTADHDDIVLQSGVHQFSLSSATPDTTTGANDGNAGLLSAADKLRLDTVKGYSQTYGNGVATSFVITHNLGSQDVVETVRRISDSAKVQPDIAYTSANTITITHSVAPTNNQFRVTVQRVSA